MVAREHKEVITPFQRLMQMPIIVWIYEKMWRKAGYFLASSRTFAEEIRTVVRLRSSCRAERILDLACGTGIFTRPLAQQGGGLIVGLDLSWPMIRYARRLAQREKIQNIFWIRGTANCLPFGDGSFQYVNCCGALHLFDRPDTALKEIYRVLAPGGHLCVQTTIRPARSMGMTYFLERFIRFGFFDEPELINKLKVHGFEIRERERHRISFTLLAAVIK